MSTLQAVGQNNSVENWIPSQIYKRPALGFSVFRTRTGFPMLHWILIYLCPLRKLNWCRVRARECWLERGKRTRRNSVSRSLHKIIRTSGIPGTFMADPYDSLQASRYLLRASQLCLCSSRSRECKHRVLPVGVTTDSARYSLKRKAGSFENITFHVL